jgi:hypothetical protein
LREQVVKAELVRVLESSETSAAGKPLKGPSSVGVRSKNSTAAALKAMQMALNAAVLAHETLPLMEYAASLRCTQRALPIYKRALLYAEGDVLTVAVRSLAPDDRDAAAAQADKSRRLFEHIKMLCEDKMFACSAATVESIMSVGDTEFEWAPAKVETQPSNYILELSSYLMATFPAFSALPPETREALYYITCKSVASRLLAQPHQPHVRKVHLAAFQRADVDLKVLESFANDTKVAGLKDCFAAPRQLIDLLTGPSLEVILEEVTRFRKFGTVDLPHLLALLDKVREPSAVNTMFFTTTAASRKREVDGVIKRLRELVKSGD